MITQTTPLQSGHSNPTVGRYAALLAALIALTFSCKSDSSSDQAASDQAASDQVESGQTSGEKTVPAEADKASAAQTPSAKAKPSGAVPSLETLTVRIRKPRRWVDEKGQGRSSSSSPANAQDMARIRAALEGASTELSPCAMQQYRRYPTSYSGRLHLNFDFYGIPTKDDEPSYSVQILPVDATDGSDDSSYSGCVTMIARKWKLPEKDMEAPLEDIEFRVAFELPPLPPTRSDDPLARFELRRQGAAFPGSQSVCGGDFGYKKYSLRTCLESGRGDDEYLGDGIPDKFPYPPEKTRTTKLRSYQGHYQRWEFASTGDKGWIVYHDSGEAGEVTAFEVDGAGPLPDGVFLALVDGPDVFEMWLVDPAKKRVFSPQSDQSYPLVAVGEARTPSASEAPPWLVFSKSCKEKDGSACVLHGKLGPLCDRLVGALPELKPGEDSMVAWRQKTVSIFPIPCVKRFDKRYP